MSGTAPPELVRHVVDTTGLPAPTAARVIADVVAYFGETTQQFVRRRHAELRRRHLHNDDIWRAIGAELLARPVLAERLSARQLRRIVYG